MDLEKADYFTIIKFGNKKNFLKKLSLEKETIANIINICDKDEISLLGRALISRKFDIAEYLLDLDSEINKTSKNGNNEFHYLAANIASSGALEIADRLLDKGVSLSQKDLKYGNSAMFTLCYEILKHRNTEGIDFLVRCLRTKPNIDDTNKAGYSVRKLIEERGTEEMKRELEAI